MQAAGDSARRLPGVSLVYVAQISLVQTDFTTECLQAKSQVAIISWRPTPIPLSGGHFVPNSSTHRYGTASIAVGPVGQRSVHECTRRPGQQRAVAGINTLALQQFAQAMATYEPGVTLSAPGMSMWASGQVLQAATAGKLSAHPTSAELVNDLDQVRNLTNGGLSPSLSYTAGKGTGPIPCYFEVEVQNGKWVAPNGANEVCS